ncbi:putative xanthine dehydrogenase subunit A [Phycisphaerae bacterium RAS1]|nr:putative xanthine dehydrogenase subunit A [Phycisphaerae bacterium RAS1]
MADAVPLKIMSDLQSTLETLLADADAGRPAALCVILRTRGSTPQAPGAAMLVRADMSTVGTLGGGCVEAEVRKRAFELLQKNKSATLDFKLDHDYGWDDGLICGGRMIVGVMPLCGTGFQPVQAPYHTDDPCHPTNRCRTLRDAVAAARRREPASFPLHVEEDGRLVEYRVHLEVPPTLLIAGAGHVGHALARLALELDFHVVVIDDRADILSPQRFPDPIERRVSDIAATLASWPLDAGSYVVIVTRGHQHDHQALDAVIRRPARYLGLIGSRRKSLMILRDLEQAGVPADRLARVHTPIGLDIGAVTVSEIAVSIAAELVKMRREATPKLVEGPL